MADSINPAFSLPTAATLAHFEIESMGEPLAILVSLDKASETEYTDIKIELGHH